MQDKNYFLMTLHRPSNVDNQKKLQKLIKNLAKLTYPFKLIFPAHLRTLKQINKEFGIPKNLKILNPISYLQFIYLLKNSKAVITDSGGVTEEATLLKIPCLTLRSSTERPETIDKGSNVLVDNNLSKLERYIDLIKKNKWKNSSVPSKWDGKASERIVRILVSLINK